MTRAMKDSGIEWIGQIPEHWDIKRNKYNFELGKDIVGTKSSKMQLLSLTKYGIKAINEDEQSGKVPTSFNTYQQVHINDLVMCLFDLDVSAVFSGLSAYEGMISPAYKCFKCKNHIYPKYVDYYFKTVFVDRKYKKYSKNVRFSINADEFMALPIVVPPQAEQQKIADYLDKKCGEIDAITAEIQEQINTLEEYKKSIISEAVTKGLDNRDNLVKSRVFYMSPYNENWKLSKIGYECTKLNRAFSTDDIPLLCTNKGEVSNRPEKMTGKMVSEDNAVQGIHEGDIAIHGMDTWHGAIAISPYKGKITRVVHVCDSKQDNRFVVYYLKHLAYQRVYKLISNGIRENTSDFRSWEKVKDIYITFPNIEEQKRICDYLDVKKSAINDIITDKQKQIETLEEYKKTLIYEYVTGKKEVA